MVMNYIIKKIDGVDTIVEEVMDDTPLATDAEVEQILADIDGVKPRSQWTFTDKLLGLALFLMDGKFVGMYLFIGLFIWVAFQVS